MVKVFGAFTDVGRSNYNGKIDGNGNKFVFSLRDDFNFVKLRCLNKIDEFYHHPDYMCFIGYFARGFYIDND